MNRRMRAGPTIVAAMHNRHERGDPMNHPQKVAVITGASQGIGAALVPAYRKLGYAVVAVARSIADSDDPDVLTVRVDVSEPGAGSRIVDAALSRSGRIDTLINNAG